MPLVESVSEFNIAAHDRDRVIAQAETHMGKRPVTVTDSSSPRSRGGKHDYFSESDYWWPDPKYPNGPYIRKDGESNPDNFQGHRLALRGMSIIVPALVAAYIVSDKQKYADEAMKHLEAWFVDEETHMAPHMQFAQAVQGVASGRDVGLVDTIHLAEVAISAIQLEKSGAVEADRFVPIKKWFRELLVWMNTNQLGLDERDHGNNHTTSWVLQSVSYAALTQSEEYLDDCRMRFKEVLLRQIADDGSYPLELERSRPYNYSIFNLDPMGGVCQVISQFGESLWNYETPEGQSYANAMAFMHPYLHDKSTWPYGDDITYWDGLPLRQPSLLFAAVAYDNPDYLETWKQLPTDPHTEEGIRNFPIRQPMLWFGLNT
jgi:hypothetical protein